MRNRIYPRWKYHATLGGKVVHSAQEENALGNGWSDDYGVVTDANLKEQIRIASTPKPLPPIEKADEPVLNETLDPYIGPCVTALEKQIEEPAKLEPAKRSRRKSKKVTQ